jgi:predicted nuclease of restriction endonuclease-like (RecB) superfamily
MSDKLTIDKQYITFLTQVKSRIQSTRIKVAHSANKELIKLYWWIGKHIVDTQQAHGWGKSVVEKLSKDLQVSFAGNIGLSTQNLWYMRQFYLEYKDHPNLQQLVGEVPWGQNLIILSKIKDPEIRAYYLHA